MRRWTQIYDNALSNIPESDNSDVAITREIDSLLTTVKWEELSREEIEDLVFSGASIAQRQGFYFGIHYAFALLLELGKL